MSQKRKLPEDIETLAIVVKNSELNGKNYIALPQEAEISGQAETGQWFAWGQNFYPIALMNEHGEYVTRKDVKITITVSCECETESQIVEPYSATASHQKGIYWFKSLEPNIAGEVRLSFTSESPGVCELEHNFPAKAVGGKRSGAKSSGSGSAKKQSKKETPKKAAKAAASAGQDDDGKADPAAGAGTSLISLDMDDDISDAMAPEEIAEVLVRRIPMPKDIDTLPYPHSHVIHAMRDSLARPGEIHTISGPALHLNLAPALVCALLDDRARMMAFSHASQDLPDSYQDQPSANELIGRTQARLIKSGDLTTMFDQIKFAFELHFENCLLYSEEKASFRGKIEGLRRSKKPFIGSFGAIYLLRLLVMLVLGIDPGPDLVVAEGPRRSAARLSSSSSSSVVADGASPAQKSQIRRNSLDSKACTASVSKLQEVIDAICSDLAEAAHFLF